MRKKFFLGAAILLLGGVFCLALIGLGQHQGSAQEVDQSAPGLAAESAGAAVVTSGLAKIAKADYVHLTDAQTTSSMNYEDMPGMAKTFTIAGTGKDEVVVMFQAEWQTSTGRALIRLVIDDVVQAGPGENGSPFVPHEGEAWSTNGFNFISQPLSPGKRTAKIQWASESGAFITVDERSMIILHR
jgi:hypothetical protein